MNVKVLLGVVAGLLLAVLIAVLVVVNVLIEQEDQRVYEACMERRGIAFDEAPVYEDADEYISRMADAAEACSA